MAGYRFGDCELDETRGVLRVDGTDVHLRPKSFELLAHFLRHPGALLTKDDLFAAVWPDVTVTDDSLVQCIGDIRSALGPDRARLIETVPRRGYRFTGEVADTAPGDAAGPAGSGRSRSWRPWLVAVAGLAVVLVLSGYAARDRLAVARAPNEPRLTIAVLPFATGEGDAGGDAWLGDGIADDVLTELSRFEDVAVVARGSSFRYRDAGVLPAVIRDELGADFFLGGSLRRLAERLRLSVRLVDTRSGTTVWAERYDRPFDEVFDVQEDIADEVATRLVVEARAATVARVGAVAPANLEAYELVLRARADYMAFTQESTAEAFALVERAIALDPGYSTAWDLYARLWAQYYIQPYDERFGQRTTLDNILAAADKAVVLDPTSSTGLATLGLAMMWAGQNEAALENISRAIALNPNNASATLMYADALSRAGYQEKSIAAWRAGERLDPFVAPLNRGLQARSHLLLGDTEAALALTRSCVERAPKLVPCLIFHAMATKALGLDDEAQAARDAILALNPRFTVARWLSLVRLSDKAQADELAGMLRAAGLPG